MPIINKPSYIPYKWIYTCMIKLEGTDEKTVITDATNPLNNPQRLVHLYEFLEENPQTLVDGAPDGIVNYQRDREMFYTFMSESQNDMAFPAETATKKRGFLIPAGLVADETVLYKWNLQTNHWDNMGTLRGEALSSSPSGFENYSAYSTVVDSTQFGFFAIKVIQNN